MAKTAAKKAAKRARRQIWTPSLIADLRRHSKERTPVAVLERLFRRTGASLRMKASKLGIPLGHQQHAKRNRV